MYDGVGGCVCVCGCVLGKVVLEGVNSHSCVRSNWRGFQSFLWQTKSKQKDRRMQDADWVGDWEKRTANTANNLIMSRSSLIFQANNYHMQRHILGKIKTREQIPPIVHQLLICNCEAILQRGKEKILPLLASSLQHYPTESFVALLSNRANELRGRRWERGRERERERGTEKKKSTQYSITRHDGGE